MKRKHSVLFAKLILLLSLATCFPVLLVAQHRPSSHVPLKNAHQSYPCTDKKGGDHNISNEDLSNEDLSDEDFLDYLDEDFLKSLNGDKEQTFWTSLQARYGEYEFMARMTLKKGSKEAKRLLTRAREYYREHKKACLIAGGVVSVALIAGTLYLLLPEKED